MANNITGDFDVVVQFGIQAVNRVLAGMHRLERFPHSMSVRVDDNAPSGSAIERPTIVGAIDYTGGPVVNHQRIGQPTPPSGAAATIAAYAGLDGIVNTNLGVILPGSIVPSRFQGRAQIQLFTPVIEVTDSSGTTVSIRIGMMSRYFPDPGTTRAAEFIRGEVRLTAPVNQIASQTGNVVEIDIKAESVGVTVTPFWSSTPLSLEDVAGIELLIRNALKTSFLPSNSTLPPRISRVQFRTLSSGVGAVAMLLNLNGGTGNPASATTIFVNAPEDFAFGVSADYVKAAFQPTLDNILSQPLDPVNFNIDAWFHTWHVTYTIVLNGATLDFESGWMVLTLTGHAHTGRSWLPDFDFTVRQKLGLEPQGSTAALTIGDISLDTSSSVANLFNGPALDAIRKVRDGALAQSGIDGVVSSMFDANGVLGDFLASLLTPARRRINQPRGFDLGYAAIDISADGIVLNGWLAVTDWPVAYADYEQIPGSPQGVHGVGGVADPYGGPDYSALKSWVPGGMIQSYEWAQQGQTQPGYVDENRFILFHSPPSSVGEMMSSMGSGGGSTGAGAAGAAASGALTDVGPATTGPLSYSQMCLTVHGSRIPASGSATPQPVSGSICGIRHFPIGGDLGLADGDAPTVSLARRGSNGQVQIDGHIAVQPDRTGSSAPNLIIHFADETSAGSTEAIARALRESKRADAPTAVIVVAPPGGLSAMRYTDGVTYAEDEGGKWAARYGITDSRRPVTLIVAPNGKITSKLEGKIDVQSFAAALRKSLVARSPVRPMFLPPARTGQPAPNFVFEFAPGHEITLSKLAGRPALLHFFRGSSLDDETAQVLREAAAKLNGKNPIILAIGADASRRGAKDQRDRTVTGITVVPDPDRLIAQAYGISAWPTTIFVDASGAIQTASLGKDLKHSGR